MCKKSFLTNLGLVRQLSSPKPYCSPFIIIWKKFIFPIGKMLRLSYLFLSDLKTTGKNSTNHLLNRIFYLYVLCVYFACLSVCPFVSNKRQNGWTDRALIFCGTSRDPREGLWMIEFSKICLQQKILKCLKSFFHKSVEFFVCFSLTMLKKKTFTIEIEDGRAQNP